MRRYSALLVIREMKIKTTIYHSTPTRMATTEKKIITDFDRGVKKSECSCTIG